MVFATCLIREGIDMAEKILNIEDLSIWYRTYRGYSQVVDHIHLHVDKGEKIGLVGEIRLRKNNNHEDRHGRPWKGSNSYTERND